MTTFAQPMARWPDSFQRSTSPSAQRVQIASDVAVVEEHGCGEGVASTDRFVDTVHVLALEIEVVTRDEEAFLL